MNILAHKKRCRCCKKTKPLKEFSKDSRSKTGYSSLCLACNKNKSKAWRDENPQKSRDSVKRYGDTHPGKKKEMFKSWISRNKERVKELARRNYRKHINAYRMDARERRRITKEKNPQRVIDYQSEWRKENPEKVKASQRKWVQNHPDKVRLKVHIRKAKKKSNGGVITEQEWTDLLEKYNHICLWCKRDDKKLTIDHIVPISRGGRNVIENIQPLCGSCNSKKGTRTMDFR